MRAKWIYIGGYLIGLAACSEKETDNTAGFASEMATLQEDHGKYEIPIMLGRPVSASALLYFEFEGDAALNGDFKLLTPSPLTISSGSQSAVIEIEITDESIIESSEEITFKLTASDASLVFSETSDQFNVTVTDNDEAPENGIQVDLTWQSETASDIDKYDLDLFIAYNVAITDDQIESFDIYSRSENETGFESVWIDADAPDGEYYIVALYTSGNDDIAFLLEVNGSDFSHDTIDGDFTNDDVGSAVFFGPLIKEANTFSKVTPSEEKMIMKAYRSDK